MGRLGARCGAVGGDLDEVEPLGHRSRRLVPVGDPLVKATRSGGWAPGSVVVDQNRAVLERSGVTLDGQVDDGV